MNIIWLSWNFPPALGGMETMVERLFKGLCARGHDIRMVTAWAPPIREDANIYRAPRPGVRAFLVFCLRQGWRQCRRDKPDIILCGSVLTAPVAWVLALIFRIKWVVPVYGSDLKAGGRLSRMMLRFLLGRADGILPISRFSKSLVEDLGVDGRRCIIIPPGVHTAPFASRPEGLSGEWQDLCRGRRVLLTVGRLVRRKGVLEFVRDVMPALALRYPNLIYLVVGDDGSQSLIHHREGMRKRIEQVIEDRGLDRHVRLLGRLADEDLINLYFHADLFVLPGLDMPGDVEGYGIVFSEAALAEVPAVASRAGGVPDAVVDGVTGILVPPGDRDALEKALISLLDDDRRRQEMGRKAAQRVRETLAWEAISARYEKALGDVIAGRV